MKMFMIFLIISVSLIGMVNCKENREDCLVTDNLQHSIDSGNEFEWLALLTRTTEMTISVAFKERNEGKDSDYITIKSNKVYREKRRNYESLGREDTNKSTFLPLGWNNFSMKVESNDMSLNINSHSIDLSFEYPIEYLYIVSEYLAACSKNKPAWKITEGKASTIPLSGLDYISHFTLSSNKPFSPVIFMNDHAFPLHYDSGVKIGHINRTLPNGSYEFLISKDNYKWKLQSKNEAGYEEVVTMIITDDLINMTVGSKKGAFLLQLNPTSFVETNDSILNSSNNIDHTQSAIIGVILACCSTILILLVVIFLLVKQKIGPNKIKKFEENQYMSV